MDIERIVVRLVVDATSYVEGLDRASARLLYFAGYVAEQVGRSAITLAADFERLSIAFEVMTGSAELGLKVLNDITKLAIESPFTSGELIAAGKQVKAFGFDTQDMIPILSRLGDVSVATGTDINRIILAFGQVRTTGRLMGQELRQFTNAGIPILEYLAKVMGVATSAVPQLVRQGRVGFADVAEAFNRMTSDGGLFFGMMERTNLETVWGRWQNVLESIQVLLRNLALEGFKLFKVNEVLTAIVDHFKALNTEDGIAGLRENIRGVYTALVLVWETVKRIYQSVVDWVEQNQQLVRNILIVLGVVIAFKATVMALGIAWALLLNPVTLFMGAILAVAAIITDFDALQVRLNRIGESLAELGPMFMESWKAIVDAVKGGDLDLAFQIGWVSIKIGWKVFVESLWVEFKNAAELGILGLDTMFRRWAINMEASLKTFFKTGIDFFPGQFDEERKRIEDKRQADLQALDRQQEEIRQTIVGPTADRMRAFMLGLPEYQELAGLREMADLTGRIGKNLVDLRNSLLAGFTQGARPDVAAAFTGALGGAAAFGIEDQAQWLQSRFAAQVNTLEFMIQSARRGIVDPGLGRVPGAGDLDTQTGKVRAAHAAMTQYTDAVSASGEAARRAAAALVSIPLEVSAGARMLAAEIGRELERGLDPFDRFTRDWVKLTEALAGPLQTPENVTALTGALGGAAVFGNDKLRGIMDQEAHDFGLYRSYEQFRKWLPNVETARPVAAMAGSREAWEILSRANTQQVDVQERIRTELMTGNAIATAQWHEQQRATAALEELRKQGVVVPRRIGQRGR